MHRTNSDMQAILDMHAKLTPLPIETLCAENARQIPLLDQAAVGVYGHSLLTKLSPFPLDIGSVGHQTIPGPEGNIMLRVYTPTGHAPRDGWPAVVYYHGGGWVIANLNTYDSSCRALCDAANCVVISAHYRQAPEHPFPAALDDAYVTYKYVTQNPKMFNICPGKIAIAGESAGGNLAAVITLKARDEGVQLPIHQLLVYPVTDVAHGANSPSAVENSVAKPLNKAMLNWFYDHYAAGSDRNDWRMSPLHASSHAGLPPATIILAEIDPLRSDGEAYAQKLSDAGVPVNLKIFEGVTHEFFGLTALVHEAKEAVAMAARDLKDAFEKVSERKMVA